MFFNSRNIRRKQIPDTLVAYKLFIDSLPEEKAKKCAFLLHTQIVDDNGTDLEAVRELLFGSDLSQKGMNWFEHTEQKVPLRERDSFQTRFMALDYFFSIQEISTSENSNHNY